MDMNYAQRVEALREVMRSRGWDAVIISGSDPHSSEYPAPRWKQVEWLSGFTGEAGDIVVTLDHAGLWTDTRYFIQAVQQLEGSGIVLHKTRIPEQVLIPEWLSSVAFCGRNYVNIAVDGLCQNVSFIQEIKDAFDEDTEVRIVSVPDLLDCLWTDRPPVPSTPIIKLSDAQVGESSEDKIEWLRAFLRSKGCDNMLLTALDEIAWLLNVRASDIDYNPLVISYLIVTQDEVRWFTRESYDDVFLSIADLQGLTYVDPSTLNYHIYNMMDAENRVCGPSPVPLRKAVKNATEIEGMRLAHFYDGLAMERFLYWLEQSVKGGQRITEWEACIEQSALRAEIDGFRGESFATISAYGPGGALPHYITPQQDAPVIEPHGLYLNDSGGQYVFGTTDITRTVPMGPCTYLEMQDYTFVLRGHINLARSIFPKGTAGCQLDAVARSPLWQAKRNFGHDTGHGIGFFLGVHEGPHEIRQNFNRQPLLPGMIATDEPGLYREGLHGVRHESVLLCREAGSNEFGDWLEWENLTLCHIDTGAIIRDLMNADEIAWLNAYNARAYETLKDHLPADVAEWLRAKTKPI